MQERLLKKIITDYAGPDAEKLVDLLYKKQNVNEFLIAKKMDLTINQTRNMLYKLADEGLVRFIRKKDKKKGGWYTYFWTLKTKRSLFKYKDKVTADIDSLGEKASSLEKERHFYCENCDLAYNEENALLNDYTCPECGETLQMKNTADAAEHLKDEIKKLKETRKQIEREVMDIEAKEEKLKGRRLKVEKKKKEEERKRRKIERDKEKAKLQKGKKKVVKKKFNKAKKKGKSKTTKKKVVKKKGKSQTAKKKIVKKKKVVKKKKPVKKKVVKKTVKKKKPSKKSSLLKKAIKRFSRKRK
ncbi:MAG: hypothetical protein ABIH92_00230 [Nanoarchaeota archaeon]